MKKLLIIGAFCLSACGPEGEIVDDTSAEIAAENGTQAGKDTSSTSSGDFEMVVMDAFAITGRDGFVSGQITQGSVTVGDTICMTSREQGSKEFVIGGIERFNKVLESAGPDTGLGVGLELKGFEAKSLNKEDKITLHASC